MNKIYSLFSIVLLMACTQTTVLEKDNFYCPEKHHYPETWFHFISTNVSMATEVIAGPDAGNALKPYGLLGPVRLCHQK